MSLIETQTLHNWIDGAWQPSASREVLPVLDPARGEPIAAVPLSLEDEVRAAVLAAARAFPAWADTPVTHRVQVLFRLKAVLDQRSEELARCVSQENGKTLAEASAEVRRGVEVVEFACAAPTFLQGTVLPEVSRGHDTTLLRLPLGVVAGITPFNFPAMIPLWMAPLALACGNTFVLKPSERTPRTANLLAECFEAAGVPPGVFNVVHGARAVVEGLLADPDVAAVSFVGSQPVAAHVYATAAANGKRVQALAGAKNHLVVLPDADLDHTVEAVVASAFGSAGERCLAGSVLVAVGGVGQELLPRLLARASALRLGPGSEPATEMGPLIREEHRRRVEGYIETGLREGAVLALDGRQTGRGCFLGPTIFTHVRPDMAIAREEIFGPVLAVMEAPTLEEAVDLVNRSRFGNAAAIFTASGKAARLFQRKVQAGMVGVNVGVPAPVAWFPFSGWKQSFYGDLHATGEDAIAFYTERKVVTARW